MSLKNVRLNKLMSVRELSSKSGVSRKVIMDIEAGKKTHYELTYYKLAKTLNCKVEEIK